MCKEANSGRFEHLKRIAASGLRGLGTFVVIVLTLRFVVGVLATGSIWEPSFDLARAEADMRALFPDRPVIADRAAADRVLRRYAAATVLAAPENAAGPLPNDDNLLDRPDDISKARRHVEALKPALQLVDQAAERTFSLVEADVPTHDPLAKQGRYGLPWTNFFGIVRRLAHAQRARALLTIHDGQLDEAAAIILSGMKLAEFPAVDRTLIGEMVGQACLRGQVAVVGAMLPRLADLPQPRLEELVTALQQTDPIFTTGRSLAGESNFGFNVIGRLTSSSDSLTIGDALGNDTLKGPSGAVILWMFRPLLASDFRCYVRIMKTVVSTVATAKTPHDLAVASRGLTHDSFEIPWYCLLTTLGTPNFRKAIERGIETRSRVDVTLITLACELQRRRTGTAPTSLAELSTDLVPTERRQDPFSGGNYCVASTEDGRTFAYGVGPNGNDDSGTGDDIR